MIGPFSVTFRRASAMVVPGLAVGRFSMRLMGDWRLAPWVGLGALAWMPLDDQASLVWLDPGAEPSVPMGSLLVVSGGLWIHTTDVWLRAGHWLTTKHGCSVMTPAGCLLLATDWPPSTGAEPAEDPGCSIDPRCWA